MCCDFFLGPKSDESEQSLDDVVKRYAQAGRPLTGVCRRFPAHVEHRLDDTCGEFKLSTGG